MLSLKMSDVKLKRDSDGNPFIEITLWDCKTDLDELHAFRVYDNPSEPGINAFFYLCEYIFMIKK